MTPPTAKKTKTVAKKRLAEKNPVKGTKSEVTRRRIIDSAARVFAQRGYAHTRLSDIAKEARSHAGGLYYYFDSRTELVEEVLRIATKRSVDAINARLEALPSNASTEDRLTAAVTAQIAEILSRNYYTAAFNKIYPQVPDDVKKRHRSVLREYFDIWRRIISNGQAAGEVRADIEPSIMRLTIVGSIQWTVEWAQPEASSADALGAQMAKLFFSGIARRRR